MTKKSPHGLIPKNKISIALNTAILHKDYSLFYSLDYDASWYRVGLEFIHFDDADDTKDVADFNKSAVVVFKRYIAVIVAVPAADYLKALAT